jgi:two-component system, cell cycle sensor histidine kinase and response regulator CckA
MASKGKGMTPAQRIVIAEDEPVAAMKLQFVLEQAGYEVRLATEGGEALKLLGEFHPDMLISDVMMPGLDGYQLCRKIRVTEDLRRILVVLLTAQTEPSDVLLGLSVGADNFIVKPFEPKDLLDRVRAMLATRNRHLKAEPAEGVEVVYRGRPYIINANRLQVLNFFINTYETQFRHQLELVSARDELSMLSRNLEQMVEERAAALTAETLERKNAEGRVAEQAALLDMAHDAIIVTTMEDKVVYWNKGAERLYGWSSGEAFDKGLRTLVMGGDTTTDASAQAGVREIGKWAGEMVHSSKSGTEITVQSSWTLVRDGEGKPKSILMINADISQKKMMEAKFLRTQRMENLGTLAGGIAHDLNNVLSPILLAMGMLKEHAKDDTVRQILSMVEQSSRRGSDMVKQVLMFGRGVEGAQMMLQPRHIVREIAKIVEQSFPKNIQLAMSTPNALPCIMGDATQLHQVLLNLCVNARDAMPQGGNLAVSIEGIELDAQYAAMNPDARAGHYVLLRVSDTGSGIAPEVQEKIFEPFYTTKEVGRGTGLGLSTVMSIVRNHGGFLRVQSEVGKGATFEVYLPAVVAENQEAPAATRPAGRRGRGETILVVDDERIVREITRVTLEDTGYHVLTAEDGTEALAMYAKQGETIDLVLTDLVMPYLDGASTIRAMQRLNPRVKVIACTGLNTEEKRAGARTLVDVPLLEKPFTASMLLTKLGEVLGQ